MLEGLVAWILNNYLGKYVENLNTDQLSIALLSGEVELENLPLKKNALRHLGLPIEIKSGFIGKVKLQIPVRQIRSAPWIIIIERLYLVATPLPVQEWDAVLENVITQEMKLSALDIFEAKWRLEKEAKDNSTYYASTYSSWLNYGTGFITDIMENLQLRIHDVHLRYEDSVSIPNKAVAVGITMDTLAAQTCDENWSPKVNPCNNGISYKLLEMQKLAIYWTEFDSDKLLSKMNLNELAHLMSTKENSNYYEHYILSPVSAHAHIKRNCNEQPLKSIDNPRLCCDLQLEEVPLTLVDWQYDQIVQCVRGLDDIARLRSYRKYRPTCTIKEDARAWWLYAISCHYPDHLPDICRPRPTWDNCLQKAKENVLYVKTYTKILMSPNTAITPEEKQIKESVEWNRDFEELKLLRELCMRSVPLQSSSSNAESSAGRSMLVGWFPQWMGWRTASNSNNTTNAETSQLEGEILQALSNSIDNNTVLKRDAVFGKFNFTLKSGTLSLCTRQEDKRNSIPMLELQFKTLSLNIISKPRTSSHVVSLSLGALYLRDKFTANSLFPVLIGPPGQDRMPNIARSKGPSPRVSLVNRIDDITDSLFFISYEKRLENTGCDYKLCIRTKSLDVVYQPAAMKWLADFLCMPHQKSITQIRIESMKMRTKQELIKNWENILDGHVNERKIWEYHLDITAPQIFFVERFCDSNSSIAVIDFGRLQLRNNPEKFEDLQKPNEMISRESEDDEMFMTPCSTPPVSEESDSPLNNFTEMINATDDTLTKAKLHNKIYDKYCLELTDLQVLIGKTKDNWRYAHSKGTSTLHVLDRFSISMQIERRIIHTSDPLYPSLTLNANLPKLVVHLNEYKVSAARTLTRLITATGLPSPFSSPEPQLEDEIIVVDEEESTSVDTSVDLSRLLTLQFTVDSLALEVQSRGRSVAELQVAGVKAAFTKRPMDVCITLTVHSLLLVDALQTFGPDFELLIASHKHVGMDSMSGSLRDSEPTSPTSPGSPDPNITRTNTTSPVALTQALSSLASSPPNLLLKTNNMTSSAILDAEALISMEILIVTGAEPMQIANIQFNNLDIIANQETIVELMGFVQRVFPEIKSQKNLNTNFVRPLVNQTSVNTSTESLLQTSTKMRSTQLTFDFHRLNVLLLRGISKDSLVVGRKIATATMTGAKIQATVESDIIIEGSLGGLQVLDLTPEGHLHQRIVSVGKDPVLDTPHPLYVMSSTLNEEEKTAFSFSIVRHLEQKGHSSDKDDAEITIRMASLWYTHSPQFIQEIQSCATEFKQYLTNLARSIRLAATDMALGLVHARAEALAQSLYMNSRLSASLYGSALSFSDFTSPRRRRRSCSMEPTFSGYSSAKDSASQTPYSPTDGSNGNIDVKLDIVLDTPVLVVPRASNSTDVFVAHLGKITIRNSNSSSENNDILNDVHSETYKIEIRDMNLLSLDTSTRRVPGPSMSRSEVLYSCDTSAKPILHDTMLELNIDREIVQSPQSRQHSLPNLLLDDEDDQFKNKIDANNVETFGNETFQITGSVVNALKLSLTRLQYEQVLDTVRWLTSSHNVESQNLVVTSFRTQGALGDICEEDTGVTTLNMDPHVRAKLFPTVSHAKNKANAKSSVAIKVCFELPIFSIELKGDSPIGEQGLVNLTFGDFIFAYEKCHKYETNIQVSLRSILMEDLLQPEGAKQRIMVMSSSPDEVPNCSACVSKSCPDIFIQPHMMSLSHGSLPDHLEPGKVFGIDIKPSPSTKQNRNDKEYPFTPPPSPSFKTNSQKNLVIISTLIVDSGAHNFKTYYNSIHKSTSIDFNCLDLVVNVESWVVVIDFFSASSSGHQSAINHKNGSIDVVDGTSQDDKEENVETNVTVRSLTVVLVKPDKDIARANISNIELAIKTNEFGKEVEGKMGSMSLYDLTLHGRIYREKFLTTGDQALYFYYKRHTHEESLNYDCQLKIKMPSVVYVHTKRFVVELQAFFHHFTQLQSVMSGIRAATSGQSIKDEIIRMSFVLEVDSPILILPVSSKSYDLLIGDFGELKVTNCFKYSGDNGTISIAAHTNTGRRCLMDVMYIDVRNVDVCTGTIENDLHLDLENAKKCDFLKFGSCIIKKCGNSLLTKKCELKLQVERNLESSICHNVPDMSIHGELSTLDASLDLSQYRLIRGLLANNLGENTEHILPSVSAPPITAEPNIRDLWTLSSLRIDLLNVTVRLINKEALLAVPLACINFIKSKLTVESFSNLSQDIDLVSQEILITDTRFENDKLEDRTNVFTRILQPIKLYKEKNFVQVEVHSRKRMDKIKFTILLNNMRLMAIFDWWITIKEFILGDSEEEPSSPMVRHKLSSEKSVESIPVETKLNITDSEIVVIEDSSQWDSNAVILKSTTVLTYKPFVIEKPLSCNLNHCEMYSCILGMEEETALSIIDPVTLNMEIKNENTLEVQLQTLSVRFSYNDMQMFMQILNSLPKQMFSQQRRKSLISADMQDYIDKLTVLGFDTNDCIKALQLCDNKLDDAALWLTQHANPISSYGSNKDASPSSDNIQIKIIEVKANNISLCVIDDCGDADLPILEIALSDFNYKQQLEATRKDKQFSSPNKTIVKCILSSDYYNRILSGWEPIIEPWECKLSWNYALTSNLTKNRLQLSLDSKSMLNINITSTLTELYKQVKESWMQDYYKINPKTQHKPSSKGRSPFVPFAIKNETGSSLYFMTLIANHIEDMEDSSKMDMKWIAVPPGEVIPFSYKARDKTRHGDSHNMKMHQICVRIDGYQHITPVTIDKVGVYFRSAIPLLLKKQKEELPPSRIVFDVCLEGRARKLVTVRSALLIVNKLNENLEIKLESQLPSESVVLWSGNKTFQLPVGNTMAVPLTHTYSLISVKPLVKQIYTYSSQFAWESVTKPNDYSYELRACHTSRGDTYRFCAEIKRENYPHYRASAVAGVLGQYIQPAHTITLLPTMLLVNLLPVDLSYNVNGVRGQAVAASECPLTFVDANVPVELSIQLENFYGSNMLIIATGLSVEFSNRIRMRDRSKRELILNALVSPHADAKLKITISSPYWIVNKTGLPLVFKQEGFSQESAGQFEEHEVARMVAPLLFNFSDTDASPTVVARVGNHVVHNGTPQWCKNFHLQHGVQVRRLHVNLRDGRPDTVFIVGIEVRAGRGKYGSTKIVTISPRFQLHNKSSYKLYFAQSCFVTNLSDPKVSNSYLNARPDSFMPFHWPALDKEQLISVLISDIPDCCWSGGLKIETSYSMHINVRDLNGRMYFLRLEVMLQGATYFVIFTDADTMPPPMRIDNFSEVSVTFAQTCCKEIVHSKARAHASVPYAWDQPTGPANITVIAPGGISRTYDMNALGEFEGPTYENFIYIAFTGTFKNSQSSRNDPLDVENQELVLDIINDNEVILARKQQGQRSQLWRMTATGQLQHEGSSPPSHSQQIKSSNMLVLDIEGPAPQPSTYTRLMLRRPDPRRQSTQTWRFTSEGRLCCAHNNMCVQAQDGFFGLRSGKHLSRWRKWNSAVLGLPQPICYRYSDCGIPIEQAVGRQRLHPGSGVLSVDITMDGPTKVLGIRDEKDKSNFNIIHDGDYLLISQIDNNVQRSRNEEETSKEFQFTLNIDGVGISLISRKPAQELLFAQFSNIVGETLFTSTKRRFCVSIGNVQIDNQLFQSQVPVVLYVTPPNSRSVDKIEHKLPALEFNAEMQLIKNENAIIFKHFIIKLKKLTIFLEELLILKLFAFVGYDFKDEELQKNIDECDYETQKLITEVAGANAKRYYFGLILLAPDEIRLSMKTVTKLPKSLYVIKKNLGLKILKFEDAGVVLVPFERKHLFDTSKFLMHSLLKHFKDELMWQAAIILGSVDFLGNPLSLVADVKEGVSGLINEGNVSALVKNVAHGLSNSAAKVTESLSDGLGRMTMDDEHEEIRQRIRLVEGGHGAEHLVAGIKGLGFGILGGATGIFKQVYAGASNEGIRGAFSGLGKGVVGAFAKPVVGVLDLASETARAVRDTSRNRYIPDRSRLPRCVFGHGGLLPRYSKKQSLGQQYLYIVNNRNYEEQLISYEILKTDNDLRIIISNQSVRIITSTDNPNLTVIMESKLSELEKCKAISEREGGEIRHYVELLLHIVGGSQFLEYQDTVKKPKVRCETAELAKTVSAQINYAKRLYDERLLTLVSDNITQVED